MNNFFRLAITFLVFYMGVLALYVPITVPHYSSANDHDSTITRQYIPNEYTVVYQEK